MRESDSLEDREFLKNLDSIIEQVSPASTRQSESGAATELTDALAVYSESKESPLNQELERARLATRATGAVVALVREQGMLCLASTGPQAPDTGVSMGPPSGLSLCCIQTRRRQQCDDTNTDPRVNPEACRQLGIRSIVVQPLLDGDELFGIVEILSSLPNAFGSQDLKVVRALADRIVERNGRNRRTNASASRELPLSDLPKLEETGLTDKQVPPALGPGLPAPRQKPGYDMWTPVLGALVIGAALLLGILVGWPLGWHRAARGPRAGSAQRPASASAKSMRPAHVPATTESPASTAWASECGSPGTPASMPQGEPTGGLTICQQGQVIFRQPPSPAGQTKPSQPSPSAKTNSTGR